MLCGGSDAAIIPIGTHLLLAAPCTVLVVIWRAMS